ncbi:DUF4235 domain-containing protein [Actinokineospora inagensis]|uniref:DUF4235 domain-containing protein n=1 Tax=Actinokineospora inagensis TaxID=103730 RepID=UPI0004283F25|nr:DUF4235 domain-containing protein [Actinokineospora inagensis]
MRLLYRPLSLLISVLGGLLAGTVFKRAWRTVSGDDEPPEATSPDHSTREVLLAALLQGAIFGVVKASVDRAGAKGFRRLTGKHLDED